MRLLILEDNPFVANLLTMLVEDCGHSVVGVETSGPRAVEVARRLRPDLLLADVDLGTVDDGIDASVQIREATGIRTVFVTANTDRETRYRAQEAWPAAFITKPIEPLTFGKVLSGIEDVQKANFGWRRAS